MSTDIETTTTAERFGLTTPRRALGLAGLARKTPAADSGDLTLDVIPSPDAEPGPDPDTHTDDERQDFEVCARAARTHHTSFWITGKALDVIAKRRLYRAQYPTFEDLLKDWDITLADSHRMRTGWPLASRLLKDVPKLTRSHVEALLPIVERYDLDAAVTLHALLRESLPKVTAKAIKEVVDALPGPDGPTALAVQIREQAEDVLTGPDNEDEDKVGGSAKSSNQLRKALDARARQLANDLKRSSIPRQELTRTLAEAFADPEDPTVYRAVVRWMRARNR